MLDLFPAFTINRDWKKETGHRIDWAHPKDINEKIQWLQCFSDTRQWSRLSDKLLVREYVKGKGLESLLVPLLGTWKRAADIPWGSLPPAFVLKCNHDSGSTRIIGPGTDRQAVSRDLDRALGQKYGYRMGELHYKRIEPCIIAEAFIGSAGARPVDYKVWCFGGKPYCIMTCHDRTENSVCLNVYTTDWVHRPEVVVPSAHYRTGGELPRPDRLDEMLRAASVLSHGFPQVRADFYEVDGRLYFGELTFTSMAGRMTYYTPEFLKELGQMVQLPE